MRIGHSIEKWSGCPESNRGLLLGRELLYQLSYSRKFGHISSIAGTPGIDVPGQPWGWPKRVTEVIWFILAPRDQLPIAWQSVTATPEGQQGCRGPRGPVLHHSVPAPHSSKAHRVAQSPVVPWTLVLCPNF